MVQNNLGLIIVSAVTLIAALGLSAVALSMPRAGRSPRPVVFVGVFKVLEDLGSRESPSGEYNWKPRRGVTFFRKGPGIDLQQTTGPWNRTVTDAGWTWQPLLFDAPGPLAWFAC